MTISFQEKNCNIESKDKNTHYSPVELLKLISEKIKELNIANDTVEVDELDQIFKYAKKNNYSMEIMYALYMLNASVEQLA